MVQYQWWEDAEKPRLLMFCLYTDYFHWHFEVLSNSQPSRQWFSKAGFRSACRDWTSLEFKFSGCNLGLNQKLCRWRSTSYNFKDTIKPSFKNKFHFSWQCEALRPPTRPQQFPFLLHSNTALDAFLAFLVPPGITWPCYQVETWGRGDLQEHLGPGKSLPPGYLCSPSQ